MGSRYELSSEALRSRLVLASGSPRRRELLAMAGFSFEVHAAAIDEAPRGGENAALYVQRLALEKARVVAERFPQAAVLGADTTVELDGTLLGKPADAAEAERMLRRLSGRTHAVHTGIAVVCGEGELAEQVRERVAVVTTRVTFGVVDEASLQVYLASGDALDKAGAYGIQGYAARWIPRIEGDYFNVVGLPIAATVALLREAGISAAA